MGVLHNHTTQAYLNHRYCQYWLNFLANFRLTKAEISNFIQRGVCVCVCVHVCVRACACLCACVSEVLLTVSLKLQLGL